MKKIVQKAVTKIIRPAIIKYYCDKCGKETGKKNPKVLYCSSVTGLESHYCKKTCDPFNNV